MSTTIFHNDESNRERRGKRCKFFARFQGQSSWETRLPERRNQRSSKTQVIYFLASFWLLIPTAFLNRLVLCLQMVWRFQLGRSTQPNLNTTNTAASKGRHRYEKLRRLSGGRGRSTTRRFNRMGRGILILTAINCDCSDIPVFPCFVFFFFFCIRDPLPFLLCALILIFCNYEEKITKTLAKDLCEIVLREKEFLSRVSFCNRHYHWF